MAFNGMEKKEQDTKLLSQPQGYVLCVCCKASTYVFLTL
jgi:hypothetical protein